VAKQFGIETIAEGRRGPSDARRIAQDGGRPRAGAMDRAAGSSSRGLDLRLQPPTRRSECQPRLKEAHADESLPENRA
jgi:hypothetical protein